MLQEEKTVERGSVVIRVLKLSGMITLGYSARAFRDKIRQEIAAGHRSFAIDMTEVDYIDSSGVGELTSASTTVRNHGGKMVLFALSERVKNILKLANVYTTFPICNTEAEAIQSFLA